MRRLYNLLLGSVLLLLAACAQPAPAGSPGPSSPADAVQVAPAALYAVAWGCGGGTDYGQCTVPVQPAGVSFKAVSAGHVHSLALRSDGQVAAWGCGSNTDLGQCTVPALPAGVTYTAVSAGYYHSLALRSNGSVAASGCSIPNDYGQCNVPALPAGVTYTAVSAGWYHSLALRSDGNVAAWGCGFFDWGQCTVPALPAGVTYTAVSASRYHSLALRSDGSVVAWGCSFFDRGQCTVPALPAGVTYTSVSGDVFHTLALRSNGSVAAWGCGSGTDYGQCTVPALSAGVSYTAVETGYFHSLALRSDGSVAAWGCGSGNDYGQCTVPALPAGVSYTAVSGGWFHSLALAPDTGPPVTSIVPSPATPNGSGGWYTTAVTLQVSASDALSGVAETRCVLDPATVPTSFDALPSSCAYSGSGASVSAEGSHVLYTASRDNAGNKESVKSLSFKIDKTPPSITFVSRLPAANGAGWNNTDVTVTWNCTDGLSGVVSSTVTRTVSTQGSGQSATGTCSDLAGNTASNTQTGINIDKTAPTLAPVVSPNPVLRNLSATATPNASDGLSGLASSSCPAVPTSSAGLQSITCTATDRAGNTTTAPASYTVLSSSQALSNLRSQVQSLPGLGFVNRTLLLATLSQAQVFLSNGVRSSAVSILNTFIGQVDGIRGISGGLTNAQANALIAQANLIIQSINAGG